MSTPCLTHLVGSDGEIIVTIYRHQDGNPASHVPDLQGVLTALHFMDVEKAAAVLVACLKVQRDSIFLYVPGSKDRGERYTYTLDKPTDGKWRLHIEKNHGSRDEELWFGLLDDASAYKGH
jgi:hypothetical protein